MSAMIVTAIGVSVYSYYLGKFSNGPTLRMSSGYYNDTCAVALAQLTPNDYNNSSTLASNVTG